MNLVPESIKRLLFLSLLLVSLLPPGWTQFPPPAGQPGTTAIYKDSSVFKTWASQCSVNRGFINFVDTTVTFQGSNKASYGMDADGTSLPDNFVVSLGDRGVATLQFPGYIYNGPGPDFAVFENGFGDDFLELGYVEVSSDGQHFIRFPGVSLTPESPQIPTFGTLDATKIHNFAGKYRVFYGTPFDLSDISDSSGISLNAITHVRITDVGGSILPGYQSFDSQGHVVNDPWPTPFNTCGFDLDAVGVIHFAALALDDPGNSFFLRVYPNPVQTILHIQSPVVSSIEIILYNSIGLKVFSNRSVAQAPVDFDMTSLPAGIYYLKCISNSGLVPAVKVIKL
jgi:hypothetical protein